MCLNLSIMIDWIVRYHRRQLIIAGGCPLKSCFCCSPLYELFEKSEYGCHQKIRWFSCFPKQEKRLERLALLDFPTTLYRFCLSSVSGIWLHVTSLCECHAGTDSLESRRAYCFIWCADMAKAFKPTRGLNAFALQYVNSQCQHDSLPLKLVAKLHLFT